MTNEVSDIERRFKKLKSASRKSFPQPRMPIDAPAQQGVYVIYDPQNRVLHVGMTPRAKGGVAQRLKITWPEIPPSPRSI